MSVLSVHEHPFFQLHVLSLIPDKINPFFHTSVHIFSLFPHNTNFLLDKRCDWDAFHAVHIFDQRRVEHSAAISILQKPLNGVELACVHDDIWGDAGILKAGIQGCILHGVCIVHDDGLVFQHFYGKFFYLRQMMFLGNTEHQVFCLEAERVHLVDVVKMHIDQSQIQSLILYQGSGTDGTILKELHRDLRVQLVKFQDEIRKKIVLNSGGMPIRIGGICLPRS